MAVRTIVQAERRRTAGEQQRQAGAYARAAGVSLAVAAGAAGLAFVASGLAPDTVTLPLFQADQWPFWLGGVGLAVLAGVLVAIVAPRQRPSALDVGGPVEAPTAEVPVAPLLPAVATFGAVLLISVYHDRALIVAAPVILYLLLCGIAIAWYHLTDELGRVRRLAQTAHVLLTHAVAFLVLATVYINKVRSLLSATTVAVLVFLLLLQLTAGAQYPAERRLIYALVGAVTLGEITWALNYWPLTGWTGGALLLIAFYFLAGLMVAQVREGVTRRDLLEYGGISALAFVIVTLSLR
ncbi:MAG TPA: hypothetical protein VFL91_11090 [Thermomicrobiales bacterium]|nr:hypothetical protein [Thermomicrobiales bacterium]